jgi:acyl-CoA synthetase (AMP-forming)/AMP-acid ligase II
MDGPASLRAALAARADASPGALAYADPERRLTFAELDARSRELAAGLQAEGVEPGDRVAIAMSAGVAFAEVFWAAQRIGAVPCALNPTAPAETVARRAARVRPRLTLDDEGARRLARPGATPDEHDVAPGDLAYLQTTSGTSGEPRAAMVTQANLLTYLDTGARVHDVQEDDVLAAWVPHWHDLGLVNYVARPVHHGIACHIVPPAIGTIPRWFETMSHVRATMSGAPDFALRLATRLVDPRRVDLSALRALTDGGEPVQAGTVRRFEERFGIPGVVLPGYGLAEATLGATTNRPGGAVRIDDRGHVSNGPALDGVEVRAGASADQPGEIRVRGATVFAGYFDDAEGTAEALRDGWLHTGDVGYLDDDGLLYVLGRRRAIIKRGGALLAPRELEEAALEVAGVRLAAAVSVPDPEGATEQIVVMAEIKDPHGGAGERAAQDIAAAVRTALGFAPERVLVVPPRTIPSTLNGKVRHARLRDLLEGGTWP